MQNAGELEEGFSVPNSVFNSLKQTLARSTIKGVSVAGGVGREYFARREGALDHATQLLLFNLQQSGVLESVGGVIRTGKEANVYRAVGGTVKDMPKDVVVKIQRPGTRDFANRHDYVEGDGRYRTTRLPHQGTRKALKLWTEKEFRNLLRANRAGLRVPAPLLHKQHCLLMEFVGSEDEPAPQLKEVELPESQWSVCYAQILAQMCMTFCRCRALIHLWVHANSCFTHRARLVHADLSEYNILYHNDAPVIIDWGQAVDLAHPDHIAYLTADAANIGHFFSARGVQTLDAHAIVRWVQNAAIKMEGDETSAAEMEQDLVQEVQEVRKLLPSSLCFLRCLWNWQLVNQLLASEIITTA
jgi:serine/threonine-protein kinase RIO1